MSTQAPAETNVAVNVQQAVPFFMVSNIEASIGYYVDGLGFRMTRRWIDEGKLRWCWLQQGGAALMLQEYRKDRMPSGKRGEGVSVCFQCSDALSIYHAAAARGIKAKRPFVGNAMWVVAFSDPDGYRIDFESPTDVPEETEYSDA
ncbi:MAG TPA: VOC family protein [Candidatus Sulfotelmatobacter sp.]|nr:VOC family protein [Candidatus Sulfotelmatobacter sp.]